MREVIQTTESREEMEGPSFPTPPSTDGNEREEAADPSIPLTAIHQWEPKLVVLSDPDSIDAENFKVLRAQVLHSREREKPRVIMVTSSFPGEGKTFVAANLAASIALGVDEHVLVIDCDLRRPHLHAMFGRGRSEGLHEYLCGKKALPELIVRTPVPKLSFLPAGQDPTNPSELLGSNMMEKFLNEVRSRYDDRFIIIDSTPSQVTSEARVLARHAEGIVLVVRAKTSPREGIQRAIQNLGREKILGVVFNGYDRKSRFNYYYSSSPSNSGRRKVEKRDEREPAVSPRPKSAEEKERQAAPPGTRKRAGRARVVLAVLVAILLLAGFLYLDGRQVPKGEIPKKDPKRETVSPTPKDAYPPISKAPEKTIDRSLTERGGIQPSLPSIQEAPPIAAVPGPDTAATGGSVPKPDVPVFGTLSAAPPQPTENRQGANGDVGSRKPAPAQSAPESKAAANLQGISEKPKISPPPPPGGALKPVMAGSHPVSLYLGSFNTMDQIERAMAIYRRKEVNPFWVKVDLGEKGIWWRVYTGFFEGIEKAEAYKREFGLSEAEPKKTPFAVKIGDFSELVELERQKASLQTLGHSAYAVPEKGGYRLLVGAYITKEGAAKEAENLRSQGFKAEMIER